LLVASSKFEGPGPVADGKVVSKTESNMGRVTVKVGGARVEKAVEEQGPRSSGGRFSLYCKTLAGEFEWVETVEIGIGSRVGLQLVPAFGFLFTLLPVFSFSFLIWVSLDLKHDQLQTGLPPSDFQPNHNPKLASRNFGRCSGAS
jgi:hypothetical protein